MREVLAVCRSSKKARTRTARILDRYFWRIGDRTWRGRASNACLDRITRELREIATRNTAVTIQEVRSARESRTPLVVIGSRSSFSPEGLVPVASHPALVPHFGGLSETASSFRAMVQIAALFHDLGKATVLFQAKLDTALAGQQTTPDAVRHELVSAVAWDHLAGGLDDMALVDLLRGITPERVDTALTTAIDPLVRLHASLRRTGDDLLSLQFEQNQHGLAFGIGALVLAHHRLPNSSDTSFSQLYASRHVDSAAKLTRGDLAIAQGVPFWHEEWWLRALRQGAERLRPDLGTQPIDMTLRASLMFADHVGSSRSAVSDVRPVHLANTRDGHPADSLAQHVRKVYDETRGAFDMFHRSRGRFPGLLEMEMPLDIVHPQIVDGRFRWQEEAASAARALCSSAAGGFFGCIISGTGSGKTRGAPTILAAATFGDMSPKRRMMRMTLGLGLRTLAKQSADEYVRDLGFSERSVSVLVGQPPIQFLNEDPDEAAYGAESRISLPDWLRVEQAGGAVPQPGTAKEADWLRGLSLDTDRQLPAFCDVAIRAAHKGGHVFRKLVETPILVATIDHLMGVAAPVNSRFLPQAVRVLTSDLILDEIDQYDPEDLAALCRLAYQVGAGGRRLLIMSATLPADVADAFFRAYRAGWSAHAVISGMVDAVNVLCTGDSPGSCATAVSEETIQTTFDRCRNVVLSALEKAPSLRRGRILPSCDSWSGLIDQVDESCSDLHGHHAALVGDFRISVGLVRMTRISHTTAVAAQLPAGLLPSGRLRLKLCLHAHFPRLHRSWVEMLLKRALTRKRHPDAGVVELCRRFGAFERAAQVGAADMEIVVIASPVIETGNDLDFDYAVIDPVSLRSVIQAAGRVNRHRLRPVTTPNVLLFSRSPIAMETRRLAKPGVETIPHKDTKVSRVMLDKESPNRNAVDLIGAGTVAVITARAMLSDEGQIALRDAEKRLRGDMLGISNPSSPTARYIASPLARLSAAMPRVRCFRRSTVRDLVYASFGENIEEADWHVDKAPGTRHSMFERVTVSDATPFLRPEEFLLSDITAQAWSDLAGIGSEMQTSEMKLLLRVEVPDYGRLSMPMCYAEATGLTRGEPEDLFEPFGKRSR